MSGRYSTNWDRKGWPGSEIQIYYTAASGAGVQLEKKLEEVQGHNMIAT